MNIYHIIDSNTNERATCLSFDTTDDAQRYLDVMSTWESSKGVSLEIAPTEVPSMTVGELIENYDCDVSGDIDIYDDYDESLGIAFCGGYILTDEGREHFKDALGINLEIGESGHYAIAHVNYFIDPDIDPDVDPDDPKFALLKQLFYGIAGYCADSDFKRWFTEKSHDPDDLFADVREILDKPDDQRSVVEIAVERLLQTDDGGLDIIKRELNAAIEERGVDVTFEVWSALLNDVMWVLEQKHELTNVLMRMPKEV